MKKRLRNKMPLIKIRPARVSDEKLVHSMLVATEFFRPGELEVAKEVFEDALKKKFRDVYHSYVACNGTKVVGWVCFGPVACTLGTFDLYWIVVEPSLQHHGIGSRLVKFAEEKIRKLRGKLVVVETSSMKRYLPTRNFYVKNCYKKAAVLKDFYHRGDGKIIYLKRLTK